MRVMLIAAAAALLVAGAASAQEGIFQRDHGKVGAPTTATAGTAPPPEGVGPGGLDFGLWRSANVSGYADSLRAKLQVRLAGKTLAASRADLEANGFVCMEPRDRPGASRAPALECRLAVSENRCEREWWAVMEEPGAALKAGYDVMCGRR